MTKRARKNKPKAKPKAPRLRREYQKACRMAELGQRSEARILLHQLLGQSPHEPLRALIQNDLAVFAAIDGELETARQGFTEALKSHSYCAAARANLDMLDADLAEIDAELVAVQKVTPRIDVLPAERPVRIALVSFLFNWPSTGGGIVHTVELGQFLARAGFAVKHFYARFAPWEIGRVTRDTPYPSEALKFEEADWNVPSIQARFRDAVTAFAPDYVIITDSWNMKPVLAEALAAFSYILRLQAMECLCPLNNVRLLPEPEGRFRQCPLHQLARPDACARCVEERGHLSGSLHQAERALSGVGTPEYAELLRRVTREAEAVLVVNPLTEAMVSPFARSVRVVTAGMDPARFPWPWPEEPERLAPQNIVTLFFAGLVEEWMKGFHVLHDACTKLWRRRQDFLLVATGEPPGEPDAFTRYVGWQSQEDLPRFLRAADVLLMPTIAQEALGRTAVEAMAVGRPVIASRIGGLSFTVADGATGLLCEPGDANDLARKIELLLHDPGLRQRLGLAGRKRFEEHYSWDVIIEKHYRSLLQRRRTDVPPVLPSATAPAAKSPHSVFRPFLPERVSHVRLIEQASTFFGRPRAEIKAQLHTYQTLHDAKGYSQTLGERKTLCFEEAFLLTLVLGLHRPQVLVEIGTQHGRSTRRMLDILELLGLKSQVVCFDVRDEVEHFNPTEARLVLRDVTGCFAEEVLQTYQPGFLFLDVHTYPLLKEALVDTMHQAPNCLVAIHDCTRGLCNPGMTLARDDPKVTSLTGIWERHVLAELFGIADPLSEALEHLETPTHRFRIFDTPHGLGLLVPR